MIFKRKIYDKLLSWKEETNGAKALFIEGARQVIMFQVVQYISLQTLNQIGMKKRITAVYLRILY